MLLEGKTALVTGAGRGIGKAIALAFASQGCDVAVTARTQEQIEATAGEIRAMGRRTLALACDVADAEGVRAMTEAVLAEFNVLDILVNNAGYACFKPFAELTAEEWQRTLDVNLTGAFNCIQAMLPSMRERSFGRIINVSSVAGLKPIADQTAYCASKFGLNGLTKTLALELRPHGIRVHAICPGAVATQLARDAMPQRDMSEWMTPEDVAHTALFLATQSDRATTDVVVVRRFGGVPLGG
ncbi:MAG: SDR family NAD(P)-dependent oxidoreductase [Nitrospiraceae bacterium]|nr:SDR family NAD(P)-dependent oxidoreductase [Nitrospiraceae bacterium]